MLPVVVCQSCGRRRAVRNNEAVPTLRLFLIVEDEIIVGDPVPSDAKTYHHADLAQRIGYGFSRDAIAGWLTGHGPRFERGRVPEAVDDDVTQRRIDVDPV